MGQHLSGARYASAYSTETDTHANNAAWTATQLTTSFLEAWVALTTT